MNPYNEKDSTPHSRWIVVLLLAALTFVPTAGFATDKARDQGQVDAASLQGNWAAAIVGNTGCGLSSMYVTFTLDAAGHGTGTATIVQHGQCADTIKKGLDFNITSLNASGSGTAGLSCGVGCGWELTIQVAQNGQIFNLVDVSRKNPKNYIAGTAIHLK